MGGRILLIEDEKNIAEAIQFVLGRDGHQVEWSVDGADLSARLAAGPVDAVILDMMLPGVSGLDLLAELKADPATRRIPVLMLTARGQVRDREAAERAGAAEFMTKPFANAEIRAAVQRLVAAGPGA